MLIIAMTWAYVVLMMAVSAKPWYMGVLMFLALAVLPLWIAFTLTVRKRRARLERMRERDQQHAQAPDTFDVDRRD